MIVRCLYDKLVPIHELKKHPQNRNDHPKEQIKELAEILNYQGWRYPIKVSKQSGYITAGHGRLLASLHNNWFEVPVNFQDYDSYEQEYADVQADNAIALWAQMDLEKIKEDLKSLPNVNTKMLGIKDLNLDELIEKIPGCDEDEVPEHVEPKTKLGDIYQLGNHRLMCGDSTSIDAVEKLMNGEKADMVFTDPPYNTGMSAKTNGDSTRLNHMFNDDFSDDDWQHLMASFCSNFWIAMKDNSVAYIHSSKVNGSILDLFGGSGSTLIACEKTNRKCFMMELDPHYCGVINARWEKYTGKKAELINGTS